MSTVQTMRWSPWLLLALAIPGVAGAQPALHTLLDNGPTAERINIVIVAEGYTEAEQADFIEDAQDVLDGILTTPPYAEYASFFNAFAIMAVSAESGSDHPLQGVARDTYFHSYYDCQNVPRLICLETEGGARLSTVLQDLIPEYDITMVLVNDAEYGGAGGRRVIASVHPSASDILMHEVGHSLAELDDEYTGGSIRAMNAHNIWEGPDWPEYDYSTIQWGYWIEASTPLPTPGTPAYRNVVGAFEMGYYFQTVYRPELTCKMRGLSSDFCTVCRELHIRAMYRLVRPIASREPAATEVEVADGTTVSFAVGTLIPDDRVTAEWFVNGALVHGIQSTALELQASDLHQGENLVEVRVTDTNEAVRAPDILPLLQDSTAWTVVRADPVAAEPAPVSVAQLLEAHPNPVRGETTFAFYLPMPGPVRLVVYDVVGREVATVVAGALTAGTHEVKWVAPRLAPGVYVYRFDAPGLTTSRRMTILR